MGYQVIGNDIWTTLVKTIPVSGAKKACVVILRVAEKWYVSGHEFLC